VPLFRSTTHYPKGGWRFRRRRYPRLSFLQVIFGASFWIFGLALTAGRWVDTRLAHFGKTRPERQAPDISSTHDQNLGAGHVEFLSAETKTIAGWNTTEALTVVNMII